MMMKNASKCLSFTGERVLSYEPEIGWLFQRHLFAYQQALGYVRVGEYGLDCGCGEGYGAHLLAEANMRVIGIDVSQQSVELARTKYSGVRLDFIQSDAVSLPFASNLFGLICAFQVIEHLNNYEAFLDDVVRVLAPDGMFLITTVNKLRYSPNSLIPCNRFHVHEFLPDELEGLLENYFSDVEFLGIFASQRFLDVEVPGKGSSKRVNDTVQRFPHFWRKLAPRFLKDAILRQLARQANSKIAREKYSVSQDDFWFGSQNLLSAIDLFAICRK